MDSIAIHSHKGGVGKTTVAVNLAVMLAKEGKNVCLLDVDFAGPNLHTFFGLEEINSLNQYFDGSADLDDCLYEFKTEMDLPGKLLVGFSDPTSASISRMVRFDSGPAKIMLKSLMTIKSIIRKDPYSIDYFILDTTPGISLTTINSFMLTDNILFIIKLSNADIEGTTEMITGLMDNLPNRSMLIANQIPSDRISTNASKKNLKALLNESLKKQPKSTKIEFLGWIPTDPSLQGIEFDNAIKSLKGEENKRVIYTLDQPKHPFTKSLGKIRKQLFE